MAVRRVRRGARAADPRHPDLLLHGEDDLIPVQVAERIAQAMPSGRLCALPRCGHFAFLESPDEVHEQITALLGGAS